MEGVEGAVMTPPETKSFTNASEVVEKDTEKPIQRLAKLRGVEVLSRKTGYLFLHGMSTEPESYFYTALRTPQNQIPPLVDRLKVVLALEPALSVHTRPANFYENIEDDTMREMKGLGVGVILNGGDVVAASPIDLGTTAITLRHRRIPENVLNPGAVNFTKLNLEDIGSDRLEEIERKVKQAVEAGKRLSDWNEFVVVNPRVAGIYVQEPWINQMAKEGQLFSLLKELKTAVDETGLPVFLIKKDGIYTAEIDLSEEGIGKHGGVVPKEERSLTLQEILESRAVLDKGTLEQWRQEYLEYPAILPLPKEIEEKLELARRLVEGRKAFLFFKGLGMKPGDVLRLPTIEYNGKEFYVVGEEIIPGRKGKVKIAISEDRVAPVNREIVEIECGENGEVEKLISINKFYIYDESIPRPDWQRLVDISYGIIPSGVMKEWENYIEGYTNYLLDKIKFLKEAIKNDKGVSEEDLLRLGIFLLGLSEIIEEGRLVQRIREKISKEIPNAEKIYSEIKERMGPNGEFRVKLEEII